MTIALPRPTFSRRPIMRSNAIQMPVQNRAKGINLMKSRRRVELEQIAALRSAVVDGLALERAITSGAADLSVLANDAHSNAPTTRYRSAQTSAEEQALRDAVRRRVLGRVMARLVGTAHENAEPGWWIPTMSMLIGDRPGLHMDAVQELTARFGR